MIEVHPIPQLPRGFSCTAINCGLKADGGEDLALFVSEVDAAAAAVFTRNHFPGAPITLGRETIKGGVLRAIAVNSKCSNVATGEPGLHNARRMAAAAAREVACSPERVLVSSTGVIGIPLPIEKIESGLSGLARQLGSDPVTGARGIMTTDSYPKAISLTVPGSSAVMSWVAKGSGMIEPNMATMLCYIFTDARVDSATLDRLLKRVVGESLNMLSVDSDTSTSDTCVIMANGVAGEVAFESFEAALREGCVRMTELLARDGEGAEHLLRVLVRGARTDGEAKMVAKSIVNSPLIKTMVHGADPNVGRILMAVGKCTSCTVDPATTDAWINGTQVIGAGLRLSFDEAGLRRSLAEEVVEIEVLLGVGHSAARAWGCDLSRGYIDENAAYFSS
ncbi:MAG: bifunctional glutamate N-acetyltransferase/amino-acid acetyltransferase ArgJ [Gemmatimonadota bacterium]